MQYAFRKQSSTRITFVIIALATGDAVLIDDIVHGSISVQF